MSNTLTAEQRLERLRKFDMAIKRVQENRKSINNRIDGERTSLKEALHNEEDADIKKIKKIDNKIDRLVADRKQENARKKTLDNNFQECLYGTGEFDESQMWFDMNEENPDKFIEKATTAKLPEKKKAKKEKINER
jgi:hypothetical protein